MQSEIRQFQQNFQNIKTLINRVNQIISPLKKNIYSYLDDKHNNKLNQSIDYITQDDGVRSQQQKLVELLKRSIYYFQNIQYDFKDQFWDKIHRIMDVDFSVLTMQQTSQIYRKIYHLILQYQKRIIQQQQQAFRQKEQAERINRIMKQKQQKKKKQQQKQRKQQQQQKKKDQQLLQNYDKMTQIILNEFDNALGQLSKSKKTVAYSISKKRRIQKDRSQKRQSITHHSNHSTGITHPRKPSKPRKPRTGRKY